MTGELDYGRLAEAVADKLEHRERRSPGRASDMAALEETIKRVASEAVNTAVPIAIAQTLTSFGLDPNDRINVQRDMLFIRDMRTLSADSKKHVLFAILGVITTGIIAAVWVYMKGTGKAP